MPTQRDPKLFQFVSYDLWADGEGGFSVNDAHLTSLKVLIDSQDDDAAILRLCVGEGIIDADKVDRVEIDNNVDNSGGTIYFRYTDAAGEYAGSPAFELRQEECNVGPGLLCPACNPKDRTIE